MSGVCVPTACGDGVKSRDEQCDAGSDNGKPGSGCSIDCLLTVCGNGKLEGEEQCDDDNLEDMDGCDSSCRADVAHRLTRMDVLRGSPPEFCAHDVNSFGNSFAGDVELPVLGVFSVISVVNDYLWGSIGDGTTNTLVHTVGLEDPSARTTDPEIEIRIYSGLPAREWDDGSKLDFPFLVEADWLTEDMQPRSSMPARNSGGGLIITTESTTARVKSPVGLFIFFDAMSRVVANVGSASPLPPPPEVIESVTVAETIGKGDPDQVPYRPEGILCGAISVDSLHAIPLDATLGEVCCPIVDTEYKRCEVGMLPPDCVSFYDLMRGGCRILPFSLGQCDEGPAFSVIHPTEPDIDNDGDGVNDAYSALIGFEGERARLVGVSGR
jgi:cysteine-rich repeat protein